MKKAPQLLLIFLLTTISIFAQSPEKMSYQAVLRDAGGTLVSSQSVGMQISILAGSDAGTAVYVERQTATTNINGLVSIEVGSGTSSDDFSLIDWASNTYFIKTETDPLGGINYTVMGTSALLSVPYALQATNSDNGITAEQASAISENTAKEGYTEALVSANTDVVANALAIATLETDVVANAFWLEDGAGNITNSNQGNVIVNSAFVSSGIIENNGLMMSPGDIHSFGEIRSNGLLRSEGGLEANGGIVNGDIAASSFLFATSTGTTTLGGGAVDVSAVGATTTIKGDLVVDGTVTVPALVAGTNTFPTTHGSASQVLTTDGAGTLAWSTPSGSSSYSIGLNADLGGYVIYVTPDGKHGLVAETENQSTSSSWFDAENIISNPTNHSTAGKNFTDWRFPTKYELNVMYTHSVNIGNFSGNYWSSTEFNDSGTSYKQNFNVGNGSVTNNDNKYYQCSLRSVRSF